RWPQAQPPIIQVWSGRDINTYGDDGSMRGDKNVYRGKLNTINQLYDCIFFALQECFFIVAL
ncbi:MAG: hypothetical protein LBJ25_06455, partial [Candidatus Margulisbacteria bacterium]|nr:hypothetical protein [Candidatus Margulisiibacteriota bacterium]